MIKQIPGYSLYSATDDGRVWSHRLRSGWLAPFMDRNGYIRFGLLGDNGKIKHMYIHQIVALTYIPNPENRTEVNHKDLNKANNSVENLEWCTHRENIQHDWANGNRKAQEGAENGHSKYPEALILQLRARYDTGGIGQSQLAKEFDLPISTVHVIVTRKQWRNI